MKCFIYQCKGHKARFSKNTARFTNFSKVGHKSKDCRRGTQFSGQVKTKKFPHCATRGRE